MAAYQPLTDNEVSETASGYFAKRKSKSLQADNPTIVLVGGQPGAGKSAASSIVKRELTITGVYIHVDADRPNHASQTIWMQYAGLSTKPQFFVSIDFV